MEDQGLQGDVWPETRSLFTVVPDGNDHREQRGEYLDRLVGESLSLQLLTGDPVGGTLVGWDGHAIIVQVKNGQFTQIN